MSRRPTSRGKRGSSPEPVNTIRDHLDEFISWVDARANGREDSLGLPTGLITLDRASGGFLPGSLTVVTGDGVADHRGLVRHFVLNSVLHTIPTLYAGVDALPTAFSVALLASLSGLHRTQLLLPETLQEDDWPQLSEVVGALAQAPLSCLFSRHITLVELLEAIDRPPEGQDPPRLVVVDYAERIMARDSDSVGGMERLAAALKSHAQDRNLALVLVAHPHPGPRYPDPERPGLAESAPLAPHPALCRDADLLLALRANPLELTILRGPLGGSIVLPLFEEPGSGRFTDGR